MTKNIKRSAEKRIFFKYYKNTDNVIISLLFIFLIFFTTFKISGDDDIFWHLETGRYIVENKVIPSSDIFGYTTAGMPWIPFEWGWDVISYSIYSFSGFEGISVFRTLIFLAMFYFYMRLIKKLKLNVFISVLFYLLLIFGMIDRMIPKPQLISYLFFSMLLYIILSFQSFNRGKIKLLYFLPPIFLVWCNMHMGVIAGAVILILFLISETISYFKPGLLPSKLIPLEKKHYAQLVFIIAISLIMLLVNPFGLNTYKYVYTHLNMKMLEDVYEWYSPFNKVFSGSIFQYIYFIFLILSSYTVYSGFVNRNYFFVLVSIIFTVFSFGSARYVIDFMVINCLLASVTAGFNISLSKNKKIKSVFSSNFPASAMGVIITIIIILLPQNNLYDFLKYPRISGFGVDSYYYPVKVVNFIKNNNIHNIGSRPFNSFNMGGYFISELKGKRNFIDSRNLSDDIYYNYKSINNKLPGFGKPLEDYSFDYFVWFYPDLVHNSVEIKTSIVSYLISRSENWKLIYWDDNSFLFVKNEEKFKDLIDKYEYKFVNPYYYIYEREPLKKAIKEHMQEVVMEVQRKYKDEPEGNFINSIVKTFKVPVSR